jgi:hypothetical protein
MLVVAKAALVRNEDTSKSFFPSVAEGGMAEVVTKGDGLRKVLIEVQRASDSA